MRSAPELRIVRSRPPRTFHVERDALLAAGYRELAPKRVSLGKLVTTLVRQAAQQLDHGTTAVLAAVSRPEEAAASACSGQLLDFRRVAVCTQHVGPLLDLAFEDAGDAVLACVGEPAAFARLAHEPLTRSLTAHNQRYELEIAELVAGWDDGRALGAKAPIRRLVAEEKPGKAFVLALEEPTLKQSAKKWQQVLKSGEAGAYPGDVVEGWAAAATVLRKDAGSGTTRTFRAASLDLCFASALVDLRQIAQLFDFAEAWFETASGMSVGAVRAVSLNIPSAAITGYARRELITRYPKLSLARFDGSPFALGWHPVRSLLDALARRELPLLYVNTADFPVVTLVGCWP
jgi:hypothetical protein